MEDVWKGTETTESNGLDNRAGREEKSMLVAERSREMAEKTGREEVEAGTGLKEQERASATTFAEPGTWTISLENAEM